MIARTTNGPGWAPHPAVITAPIPRVRDYIIIVPSPAPSEPAPPRVAAIKQAVVEHYGLDASDMTTARRAQTIAHPRQVAMYLCRKLTLRSLPEIGRMFGGRDHSTVIHAVKQVEYRLATDPDLRDAVALISAAIGEAQ
jgi:chromosomal replication initiation ATPase DnaA